MKPFFLFFITVFTLISINIKGQNTYTGTIIELFSPCVTETGKPWAYLIGFETISGDYYILTVNSHQIVSSDKLIIEGVEYFDNVVITGTTKEGQCGNSKEYRELEIETIEKWSPNQNFQHILGTYILEGICKDDIDPDLSFPRQDVEFILSKLAGIEDIQCQLDSHTSWGFMMNDSLIIPLNYFPVPSGSMVSFAGRGKIENDSIFFYCVEGIGYVEDNVIFRSCGYKGKKKNTSNIVSPLESTKNKVLLDATKQAIVIDETLLNQSFTFELINMQGSTILKKSNINESISIANLPSGIYLCRILQNGQVIYSDKILKR